MAQLHIHSLRKRLIGLFCIRGQSGFHIPRGGGFWVVKCIGVQPSHMSGIGIDEPQIKHSSRRLAQRLSKGRKFSVIHTDIQNGARTAPIRTAR